MGIANAFKQIFIKEEEKYFDLTQELNRMLPLESNLLPPTPQQNYRVSHVIKLCPREEVLKYIHQVSKPEKIDAKLRRIFDIGKAFHSLVQNEWFGKWGWLIGDWECRNCHQMFLNKTIPLVCHGCGSKDNFFYHELEPFNQSLGITAHLDGVLLFQGRKIVVELKTANSIHFHLITNIKKKPQDAHIKQIQMYMFLTGIKDGVILYFEKDESSIHHFDVKYDPVLVGEMLENLNKARQGMLNQIVPERTICKTKSCFRAKMCAVRDLCFSGKIKEKLYDKKKSEGS